MEIGRLELGVMKLVHAYVRHIKITEVASRRRGVAYQNINEINRGEDRPHAVHQ